MMKPDRKTMQGAAMHSPEAVRLMRSRSSSTQPSVSPEMLKLDARTKRRVLVAGTLVVFLLVFVVGFAYQAGIIGQDTDRDVVPSESQELTTRGFLEMMVYADGWDAENATSPVLCVRREDGTPVLFHAVFANQRETVELEAGTYVVEFIAPVVSGGAIYRSDGPQTVEVAIGHTVNIAATLEYLPPEAVSYDDYQAIIAAFDEALDLGDATLRGDEGQTLRVRLMANVESGPNFQQPDYYPDWDYTYDYYSYDYSWLSPEDGEDAPADEGNAVSDEVSASEGDGGEVLIDNESVDAGASGEEIDDAV